MEGWKRAPAALLLAGLMLASAAFEAPAATTLELGYEVEQFAYEELDEMMVTTMEETGTLHGPRARLRHTLSEKWTAGIDGRALSGQLHYDGATWAGQPRESGTSDFLAEARALIGPAIIRSESAEAVLYTGFGYRFWHNTIRGPGGYGREVEYYYFPTIIDLSSPVTPDSRIGFTFELDGLLRGVVRSHLSDVDNGSTDDATNVQPSGMGVRMSIYYTSKVGARASLSVEPYVIIWHVQQSNPDSVRTAGGRTLVAEPENQTIEGGLAISLKW